MTKTKSNVILSDAMQKRIQKEGLNASDVIDETVKLRNLMQNKTLSEEQKAKAISYAESGLVDFSAKFGRTKISFYRCINSDPHFLLDYILNDAFYAAQDSQEQQKELLDWAKAGGWEKTLCALFEIPTFKDMIFSINAWAFIYFEKSVPLFLERVCKEPRVSLDNFASFVCKNIAKKSDRKSFEVLLATGWLPDESTIGELIEEESLPLLEALIESGADFSDLHQMLASQKQRHERASNSVPSFCTAALNKIVDTHLRWRMAQDVLAEGSSIWLERADLIAAGNVGDDALRQFMNPKYWRTEEQRAHLRSLLDTAPPQITDRVKTRQALLENPQQQNGWGRG